MERLKETLSFVNNKGGVAKTTTVQNVAAGLLNANQAFRILCIDLDPQGNLSTLLGWREKKRLNSIYNKTVADALKSGEQGHLPVYKSTEGLWYSPAANSLADIEPDLHRQMSSKMVLAGILGNPFDYVDGTGESGKYVEDEFDYILIDCAPALSELTYNALGAASGVIIPVQLGSLSVDGIGRMVEAYRAVRRHLNPTLDLRGMLIVMADERTCLARETTDFLRESYGDIMFNTRIRQCIRVGESQFQHQSIFDYAPDCTAAIDYEAFVRELIATQHIDNQ